MKQTVPSVGDSPQRPYTAVIKGRGSFVYVAGQGPFDLNTWKLKKGTLEDQIRLTLDNVRTHLQKAGATLNDVVNCRIYLSELNQENFETMNRVYKEYFSSNRPTRTTIGCQLLGIDVEIDCVACVDD